MRSRLVFPLVCLSALTACNGAPPSAEQLGQSVAAIETAGDSRTECVNCVSFAIRLPAGMGASDLALSAAEGLYLSDRVRVQTASGATAPVGNTGATRTEIGADAKVGTVISQAGVFLRSRANVTGDLRTAGTLDRQDGTVVTGTITAGAEMSPHELSWSIESSAVATEDILQPRSAPLEPGAYKRVSVPPRGVLRVKPGQYIMDSLILEPESKLFLEPGGPVTLVIKGDFTFRGQIVAAQGSPEVVVAVKQGNVFIERPFTGTLLAPNSDVRLQGNAGPHVGAFFGKTLRVEPDTVIVHRPSPLWDGCHNDCHGKGVCHTDTFPAMYCACELNTLGNNCEYAIEVDKTQLCVNESSEVRVTDPRLSSVRVMSRASNTALARFTAPGTPIVTVSAVTPDGKRVSGRVGFLVQDCVGVPLPALVATPVMGTPLAARFRVKNPHAYPNDVQYDWAFGDGTSATTSLPYIEHDYTAAVGLTEVTRVFEASVTARWAEGSKSSRMRIDWFNRRAFERGRGNAELTATVVSPFQANGLGGYSAQVNLKNPEPSTANMNAERIDLQSCDPGGTPSMLGTQSISFAVAPNSSASTQVTLADLPAGFCGATVHFGGQVGALKATSSVYVPATVAKPTTRPLRDPVIRNLVNDVTRRGLVANPNNISERELLELSWRGLIEFPPKGASNDWATPVQAGEGGVVVDPTAVLRSSAPSRFPRTAPGTGTPDPVGPVIGDECIPGETSAGLDCVPTEEIRVLPARVINARKGDIILSPGGSGGAVGELLLAVTPPQFFSHSGIFVDNGFWIRHSTFSEDRLQQYPRGTLSFLDVPSQAFEEDVLKYGWPGTVDQNALGAFLGDDFVDMYAETNKEDTFKIKMFDLGFEYVRDDKYFVPASIVQPHWSTESMQVLKDTRTVRAVLHDVAEQAKQIRAHYRFGVYSNAALGDTVLSGITVPGRSLWAGGTEAEVCSSFIWDAARRANAHLEGDQLEPSDTLAGYPVGSVVMGSKDGLYLYDEKERLAAGEQLYDFLWEKVNKEIWKKIHDTPVKEVAILVNVLTGNAPALVLDGLNRLVTGKSMIENELWTLLTTVYNVQSNIANQMVNCFCFDECLPHAGEDTGANEMFSRQWWRKYPGTAESVSPDDLLKWDAPPYGVYGSSQEVIREGVNLRRVFRWQATQGHGIVNVQVQWPDGAGVPNVPVTIDESIVMPTGSDGWVQDGTGNKLDISLPPGQHSFLVWTTSATGGTPGGTSSINTARATSTVQACPNLEGLDLSDPAILESVAVALSACRENVELVLMSGVQGIPQEIKDRYLPRIRFYGRLHVHNEYGGGTDNSDKDFDETVLFDPDENGSIVNEQSLCNKHGKNVLGVLESKVTVVDEAWELRFQEKAMLFEKAGGGCDRDDEEKSPVTWEFNMTPAQSIGSKGFKVTSDEASDNDSFSGDVYVDYLCPLVGCSVLSPPPRP